MAFGTNLDAYGWVEEDGVHGPLLLCASHARLIAAGKNRRCVWEQSEIPTTIHRVVRADVAEIVQTFRQAREHAMGCATCSIQRGAAKLFDARVLVPPLVLADLGAPVLAAVG